MKFSDKGLVAQEDECQSDMNDARCYTHPSLESLRTWETEELKRGSEVAGPGASETVQGLGVHDVVPAGQYHFLPFIKYLRLRHGYDAALEESFYKEYHEKEDKKLCIAKGNSKDVLKRLLYGTANVTTILPAQAHTSITDFYNTALAIKSVDAEQQPVVSCILPPPWDISECSRVTPALVCDLRKLDLRCVKAQDGGILYILRPPRGSKHPSPWFAATTSATAVLFVYRMGWKTMLEIGRGFLELGIPFRTVMEVKRTGLPPPPTRHRSEGVGPRPQSWKPTQEDFVAYESARDQILQSSRGRAVRLLGGLVGRIASGIVTDVKVLDGPIVGDEIVGYSGDTYFVDDAVDEESLDIVSGVFHVRLPDGANVRQDSLWPKHWTWMCSGLAGDQWSPGAEHFYQTRLAEFRAGNFTVKKPSAWKESCKLSKVALNRVLEGSERLAAEFIGCSQQVR